MSKQDKYQYLNDIDYPSDLKKLKLKNLKVVCSELRDFIIDSVSQNPGHFGASLGVVELTVALQYVFNTPKDKIIWDVGHQAYAHKILTGRKSNFHTNRKFKGISGFPKMSESEYDSFGVGHSSTSISAALGMAEACKITNDKSNIVAVIGDGALTGGMAFEALNNAGMSKSNLLVILNDNDMAIDPNVGALNKYFTDVVTSKAYNDIKKRAWNFFGLLNRIYPRTRSRIQQTVHGIKSTVLKEGNLFEALNFRFFGPVDGHDVRSLVKTLEDLKNIEGPKVLHIKTKKGKGFELAEKNQTKWHAPGKFDKKTGEILVSDSNKPLPPKFQDVFGETIVELAQKNDKIVGITPAMPSGSSLNIMMEKMPDRAFDVGIAEQHAVTFSAGLAVQGLTPFCNIYSSFMQRSFDQVIHDVALQKLNVIFCLDRAGLVGEDGPTHHGAYDLAYMNCIPGVTIASPMNEHELRNLMYTAQKEDQGPFVIRYPRGRGSLVDWKNKFEEIEIGKARQISSGSDIAVLTIGPVGETVRKVSEELSTVGTNVAHYDMRFLKPIDNDVLHEVCKQFNNIITIEDASVVGGLGSEVVNFANDNNYNVKVKKLGIPDSYVEHGTPQELYKVCGFDSDSIKEAIKASI